MGAVLKRCLRLALAGTKTGALEWAREPLLDLQEWVEAVNTLNKTKTGSK